MFRHALRQYRAIKLSSPRVPRMLSTIQVKPIPTRNADLSQSKAHHAPSGFQNPWPSYTKLGLSSAFQHRFGNHPEKKFVPVPQGANGERSDELVRVRRPDWGAGQNDRLRATWLGHASFFVETPAAPGAERGIRILLDPVFSDRTSPSQWIGPKRYTPPPCTLDEVPDVDVIAISHNHYDHLDYASVQHLYNKRRGKLHFVCGLNDKKWFTKHVGCQAQEVTEADWWDSFELNVDGLGSVELTCCPTQHNSGRSPWDMGHGLWCGWAIKAGGKNLYFSGDTAYQAKDTPEPCPAFAQIGTALGPFHLALLPIGLMTPHSFMGSVHATPEQSIQIHRDVKAKVSIGMHYGTVRGGISGQYEDVRDPPRRWRAAAEKENLWSGGGVEGGGGPVDTSKEGVGLCDVGETVAV